MPSQQDLLNGLPAYQNNLNNIVQNNTASSDILPHVGSYSGNGTNDFWNKAEALAQTYYPQYQGIDFVHDHSVTSQSYAQNMINDVTMTEGQISYNDPRADSVDFLRVQPRSLGDVAAEKHDISLGEATDPNNGLNSDQRTEAAVSADFQAAKDSFSAFLQEGKPYDIVQGAFLGAVGVATDVIHQVHSAFDSIVSAFQSSDGTQSPSSTTNADGSSTYTYGVSDSTVTLNSTSNGQISSATFFSRDSGVPSADSIFTSGQSLDFSQASGAYVQDLSSGDNYLNLGSGDTVSILGTGGDSLAASNASITDYTNQTFGLNGNGNIVDLGTSGTVDATGTSEQIIGRDGDTVNSSNGSDNTLYGYGTRYNIASNATVIDDAVTRTVLATTDNSSVMGFGANTNSEIIGNGGQVALEGNNVDVNASTNVEYIYSPAQLTGEVIDASNTQFYVGSGINLDIVGSHDSVHGGTHDTIDVSGQYDTVAADSSTIDYSGSDTGDDVYGSGDTGTDWADPGGNNDPGGGGGYGGYGDYGGYALLSQAATQGTNIGAIAQHDIDLHNQSAAITAVTARLQANLAATSVVTGPFQSVLEGPKWTSNTITWSIADDTSAGMTRSQEEAAAQQAFQAWAGASGLQFQEVTDPTSKADISISWDKFNPQSSGVLGYTDIKGMLGSIQAGATIQLEDPTETALTTDGSGQLAYSGTQTEFVQLLEHEIGHALGLADNSDPNSIEAAFLSSANRTLDATDLAGIGSLYAQTTVGALANGAASPASLTGVVGSALTSTGTAAATYWYNLGSSAAQLIDALAAFSPTAPPAMPIGATTALGPIPADPALALAVSSMSSIPSALQHGNLALV